MKKVNVIVALGLAMSLMMSPVALAAPGDFDEAIGVENANSAPSPKEVDAYFRNYTSKAPQRTSYQANGPKLADYARVDRFARQPKKDGTDPGDLKAFAREDLLHQINSYRYAIGLKPVSLTSELNAKAQAAAYVNTYIFEKTGGLSHYPERRDMISSMPDSVFAQGKAGASISNIAADRIQFAVRDFIDDGDASNRANTGHRQWLSSYNLKRVGVGNAKNVTAVSFDMSGSKKDAVIASPSRYVLHDWMNENNLPLAVYFDESTPGTFNIQNASVTVTRLSDHKAWTFTKGRGLNLGKGYCYSKTITFGGSSDMLLKKCDDYLIKVNGVTKNGSAYPIAYTVRVAAFGNSEVPDVDPNTGEKLNPDNPQSSDNDHSSETQPGKKPDKKPEDKPGNKPGNKGGLGGMYFDNLADEGDVEQAPTTKQVAETTQQAKEKSKNETTQQAKEKSKVAPKTGDPIMATLYTLGCAAAGLYATSKKNLK